MARRKIRPEVLRPFLLAIAMVVGLFVLQFWRKVPPDIRQEQLGKAHVGNFQKIYGALQQYQAQYGTLPAQWPDLRQIHFSFESLELPDQEPRHPILAHSPEGPQMHNMPYKLVQQGQVEFAQPRKPLVEFSGSKEVPPGTLYTDGSLDWVRQ